MKRFQLVCLLLCVYTLSWSQIETSTSLRIDAKEDKDSPSLLFTDTPDPEELEKRFPLYTSLRDSLGFNRTQKPFSMIEDNGLLKPEANPTPKWFENDKPILDAYKKNQYLGDFVSNSEFVSLVYRDHEAVDGDLVRIFVNDDIIRSKVFLGGAFQGVKIAMVKGFNKIEILALNQGESGPNTAEFRLYDEQGNLITANEWNLTTGVKATMIVVKK